jgi:hypothetical protein
MATTWVNSIAICSIRWQILWIRPLGAISIGAIRQTERAKPGALGKWQHHDPVAAKARPAGERA